jgi:hypothetical protein
MRQPTVLAVFMHIMVNNAQIISKLKCNTHPSKVTVIELDSYGLLA